MELFRLNLTVMLAIASCATSLIAQSPQEFGPRGPGRFGPGGPGQRSTRKLLDEFDRDENGWLNTAERAAARESARADGGGRRGFGPPGGRRNRGPGKPGRLVSQEDTKYWQDASLYDPAAFRTLFFEFEHDDWERELEDFHGTDVEVPARLTVDGRVYENVGVRFRGASSYGMVPTGLKRSFNVSIDLAVEDQRLYGYKTLNLLNSAGDPSMMSTVLYSHIASDYIPVPKANHVHVVINGESWGVYVNVQQFNKDFLAEHFESTKGTRWKVSGSPGADGGLRYLGEDVDEYKRRFEMKSNDGKRAWAALINLCRTLNETPLDRLQDELEPLLDIDETLRFLALDVATVNSDGYWTRASDYSLFLDSNNRFHVIPHDMNEAFHSGRGPGGPGGPRGRGPGGRGGPPPAFGGPEPPPGFNPDGEDPPRERDRDPDTPRPRQGANERRRGPRGPGHGGVELDPLVSIDNPRMPLRSRLLAVPELRASYLTYVREIAERSFDWEHVGPVIARHRKLIESEVAADTRKLDTLEAFQQMTSDDTSDAVGGRSLRSFFEQRREFLLNYKSSSHPTGT